LKRANIFSSNAKFASHPGRHMKGCRMRFGELEPTGQELGTD
jgi:hypothetical protein